MFWCGRFDVNTCAIGIESVDVYGRVIDGTILGNRGRSDVGSCRIMAR